MGALDDALNAIEDNGAALEELGTLRSEYEAATGRITTLTEELQSSSSKLTELQTRLDTTSNSKTEVDAELAKLRSQAEEFVTTKTSLETLTREKEELQKSYEGLHSKITADTKSRLLSYGLEEADLGDKSLEVLEAMEATALKIGNSSGAGTAGQGLGGGTGSGGGNRLASPLEAAAAEIVELQQRATQGGRQL